MNVTLYAYRLPSVKPSLTRTEDSWYRTLHSGILRAFHSPVLLERMYLKSLTDCLVNVVNLKTYWWKRRAMPQLFCNVEAGCTDKGRLLLVLGNKIETVGVPNFFFFFTHDRQVEANP